MKEWLADSGEMLALVDVLSVDCVVSQNVLKVMALQNQQLADAGGVV
jgi:hypothetical protein